MTVKTVGICGPRSQRTTLEKCLIPFSLVMFMAAVAFTVAFVTYLERTRELENICTTGECVETAARLRGGLDQSVDPCDDFYQFACGTWMKKNLVPEDKSLLDTMGVMRDDVAVTLKGLLEKHSNDDVTAVKKAKDLYNSCINESLIEERSRQPALDLLAALGGWPMINNSWSEADFDLEGLLIQIRKMNYGPLFTLTSFTDLKNSSATILYVDQPNLGMPGQQYYQRSRDDALVKAYEELITNIARELSGNTVDVSNEVKEMVDLEFVLAGILVPDEERRDPNALYNMFTVSGLIANYTKIDWKRYFNEVMNWTEVGIELSMEEPLINYSPTYFEKLMGVLENTPKRTLANYLVGRTMMSLTGALNQKFQDFWADYNKVLFGTRTSSPRFRICTSYAVSHTGLAVGREFVKNTFDEDAKSIVDEMIFNLRTSFNELLEEQDWLGVKEKGVAREKAAAMKYRIGYPQYILNDTLINTIYKKNSYDPMKFFENVLHNNRRVAVENLKSLRLKVDKNLWTEAPSTVNAGYQGTTNQMSFPAGFLQRPFFNKAYPKSLNYGGLGMVIGHEITHGFDDRGRQYDKDGNLVDWWGAESLKQFKAKAQCIIDQYSDYVVPEAGMKINGIKTQSDNIADNGGLKQSFRAYRQLISDQGGMEEKLLPGLNYTHNQLFFINFAQNWCTNMRKEGAVSWILTQVHSPGRYRVIGTLQNSPEFSEVFNCPLNSYMNPEKKCKVW